MNTIKDKIRFEKYKKIYFVSLVCVLALALLYKVYASGDHDEPTEGVKQTEKILIRTVGDTDPDAISQEGLGGFFGEIISKDISSVHPPREGVLSSWNVSVGDYVSLGDVLGYVTVTGISPEQQALLVEQQTNAFKAQLDAETASAVAIESETVFGKVIDSFKAITNKQKSIYDGNSGTSSSAYITELKTLQARQLSLENKLQDFGNTTILSIFPLVSKFGQSPFNQGYTDVSVKFEVGTKNSNLRNMYVDLLRSYATKTSLRSLTETEIQDFLNKTNQIMEASSQGGDLDVTKVTDAVKDLQNDLRELTTSLDDARLAKVTKEREYNQLDIELSKNVATLDNDLALKKLDQVTLQKRAQNEARAAQLLAEKLSQNAGGVIPILSPRDGIVASVEKNTGDYVSMSDRVGYVSVYSPTKSVRFTIPPSWKEIRKGDSLAVIWRPDFSPRSGIITGISPMINEKGGYQAEALLSADTEYPVGASVNLVPEKSKSGVFVNRKAVQFGTSTIPYVWVVSHENKLTKTTIKAGRQLGEYVEVTSGLKRGVSYLVVMDHDLSFEENQDITPLLKQKVEKKEGEEEEGDGHDH
jgi:hypothetical protein